MVIIRISLLSIGNLWQPLLVVASFNVTVMSTCVGDAYEQTSLLIEMSKNIFSTLYGLRTRFSNFGKILFDKQEFIGTLCRGRGHVRFPNALFI